MPSSGLTFRDLRNAILFATLVVLLLLFIRLVANVLLMFSLVLLIVVSVSPLITWMHKRGIPRPLGTAIVVVAFAGAIVGLGYFVVPAIVAQTTQLAAELPRLLSIIQSHLARLLERIPGLDLSRIRVDLRALGQFVPTFLGGITQVTTGTLSALGALLVMLVASVYALANPKPLVDGFLNSVNPEYRTRVAAAGQRVAVQIWAWAKGTLFAMFAVFALTWLALWLLGFEQALLFAVIAGVLELVPVIGPIASAVPPTLVALVDSPIRALWVIGAFVVVQQFESNVLIPLVMARQVRLHPVTVVFWVLVMASLFGIVGIFIATPTAVVAGVLYDELYLCEYRDRCKETSADKEREEQDIEEAKQQGVEEARERQRQQEATGGHNDESRG